MYLISKTWFLFTKIIRKYVYVCTWNCFVKLRATILQNLSLSTFCKNLHDLFEHAIYAWLLCFNYGVKFLWPASVVFYGQELKSVNLQYNTLDRLDDETNESLTKRLMFQVLFFFMISYKFLCKNPFNLFSCFFYKITKMKIKSFECRKSIKSK